MTAPTVSVVIPVRNEAPALPELIDRIVAVMHPWRWELIVADDHSTDDSARICRECFNRARSSGSPTPGFQIVQSNKKGKDHALAAAFTAARNDSIVTLDADLQNPPEDIPVLLKALGTCDMACGWRRKRFDPWTVKTASLIANRYRDLVTGIKIKDAGCGLKAFRTRNAALLLEHTDRFDGCAHLFYATLFAMHGLRITEIPVSHAPRKYGTSKFRFVRGRTLSGVRGCLLIRKLLMGLGRLR